MKASTAAPSESSGSPGLPALRREVGDALAASALVLRFDESVGERKLGPGLGAGLFNALN